LHPASVVIADRGYDWRHLIDLVNQRGGLTRPFQTRYLSDKQKSKSPENIFFSVVY